MESCADRYRAPCSFAESFKALNGWRRRVYFGSDGPWVDTRWKRSIKPNFPAEALFVRYLVEFLPRFYRAVLSAISDSISLFVLSSFFQAFPPTLPRLLGSRNPNVPPRLISSIAAEPRSATWDHASGKEFSVADFPELKPRFSFWRSVPPRN